MIEGKKLINSISKTVKTNGMKIKSNCKNASINQDDLEQSKDFHKGTRHQSEYGLQDQS
jgi:hypothetical protein